MPVQPQSEIVEQLPPELLNEENKILTQQIKEQEQLERDIEKKVDDQDERIKVLKDHFKNVQSELVHTQRLKDAKAKEIEDENHYIQLAEREIGKVRTETKKFSDQTTELSDQLDSTRNEIFMANEKIDKYRVHMNFNEEELEQWTLAQKQKEEDKIAMDRYKRQDESKVKKYSLQLEKLTNEKEERTRTLENEITETQALQIELEKTSESFKEAQDEREKLVKQWENAIKRMKQKDEIIRLQGKKFSEQKIRIRDLQEMLLKENQHLQIHVQNNKEMKDKIEEATRVVEKTKNQCEEIKKTNAEIIDEIDVIKNTLAKASTELNGTIMERNYFESEVERKAKALLSLEKRRERAKKQLETAKRRLGDLQSKADHVDEIHNDAEQRLQAIERNLQELKENQYKISQGLFQEKQKEQTLAAEISGGNAQINNMDLKLQQLDQEEYKQHELLYSIEFNIQRMERKVARAQGERTEEEKLALNAKIEELQDNLNTVSEECDMLSKEHNKVQHDVKMLSKELSDKKAKAAKDLEREEELNLESETCSIEMKKLVKEKDELLVQHDVLQLQTKRLRSVLRNRADEVSGLENRKFQLEMSYKEKEIQFRAHLDILVAEQKSCEEERRRVALELAERKLLIDKLKNKFDIMVKRMHPSDEEGEVSQAQFLIRAIQEKEELQRTGDILDEEIQKLEKQEKGLLKVLSLFRESNNNHLGSLKRVGQSDEQIQKKNELEQKLKEMDILISRRLQERAVYEQSASMKQSEFQTAQHELQDAMAIERHLHESVALLQQDIDDQRSKLAIHTNNVSRARRDAKKIYAPNSREMQDIKCLDMRARNRQALQMLALFVQNQEDPGVANTLNRLLNAKGLKVPDSSRPSSVTSSVVSRLSSARSVRSSRSSIASN